MDFVNRPSNRTGLVGSRSYAELFCGLILRPGAGVGDLNNVQDPGVREALRESTFYGGAGSLNRTSFSRLNERRGLAESVFELFLRAHG